MSVADALKLYTTNAAYVNGVEDKVGTLSPGKLADIVVVDRNPLGVYSETLNDVRVDMTFVDGQEVYARG